MIRVELKVASDQGPGVTRTWTLPEGDVLSRVMVYTDRYENAADPLAAVLGLETVVRKLELSIALDLRSGDPIG